MVRDDTDIGGGRVRFPETRHSLVDAIRNEDPGVRRDAFEQLIASYWKPVYKYVRLKWSAGNEEAKDLTQGFFTDALARPTLERYDPSKARFRTWLRICLDGFVTNQRKARGRLKRGGEVRHLPVDFDGAEGELSRHEPRFEADAEALFRQEWLRGLLSAAVDELRRQSSGDGREVAFAIFERYDLEGREAERPPSYSDLAGEFGVPVTKVTNALHTMRRRFRDTVLEQLHRICASEREFRAEALEIFGVDLS